jgi:hypothetical protein
MNEMSKKAVVVVLLGRWQAGVKNTITRECRHMQHCKY